MEYTDLTVGPDTRSVLEKLRSGQIRGFRGARLQGDEIATTVGFYCTTNPVYLQKVCGIDPRRIGSSDLRADRTIDVYITYGIRVFSHYNDKPEYPDWHTYPEGRKPANGTQPTRQRWSMATRRRRRIRWRCACTRASPARPRTVSALSSWLSCSATDDDARPGNTPGRLHP